MGGETVNILRVELDELLDEAGFRHVAATLGPRLGARRIGASVYEAGAGVPIWPYHYHHGIEEWLYVISGAPVLRAPAGERTLAPGDLICLPEGPSGAHQLSNRSESDVRALLLTTTGLPANVHYPDSGRWLLRHAEGDVWVASIPSCP